MGENVCDCFNPDIYWDQNGYIVLMKLLCVAFRRKFKVCEKMYVILSIPISIGIRMASPDENCFVIFGLPGFMSKL